MKHSRYYKPQSFKEQSMCTCSLISGEAVAGQWLNVSDQSCNVIQLGL